VKTLIVSKTRVLLTLIVVFAGSLVFFIACNKSESLPVLTTDNVTGITRTTATSGGNITDDGGASIKSRGVCWNTSASPATSDNKVIAGSGAGSFTGELTNLTPGTMYYVRAFATNSVGTAYGNEVTFTTELTSLATVTTSAVSSITSTTAVSGGEVTSDGGETVTARGVCWSTSENPTTADSKTDDGSGTGIFVSSLMDLSPNTTYYVRAYSTNNTGTAYGDQVTFTTQGTQGLNEVLIQGFAFVPATITIPANTTVTWTNKDAAAHTVTSNTGDFDSGSMATNDTYSHLFTTPGSYPYHCTFHPDMTATVVVN
jgi:plastocyanin